MAEEEVEEEQQPEVCSGYGMASDMLNHGDVHPRCRITTPHTSHPIRKE